MNTPSKTGRARGLIFRAIRSVASQRETFTALDVPLPPEVAIWNCSTLATRGELDRVVPGRRGRFGFRHAVYRRTEKLRAADLTNHQL